MPLRLNREEILGGKVVKTMFLLGWPLMLSSLLQTLYNLADMFWLGRLPREQASVAVASINFTFPLVFFFISFAIGLGRVATPIISQYIGANDRKMANRYAGQIISTVLIISLIMGITGFIFVEPIFAVMGARGEFLQVASEYAGIIFLGIPFMFIAQGGGMIVSSEGDTITPLIINGISVTINIILDPFFIFGWLFFPQMGVVGAAVATVIARSIAAFWLLHLLFGGKLRLKPTKEDLKPRKEHIKFILKIGIPSSIGMSTSAFGFVVIQSILANLPNQVLAIASYGVGNRIVNMMFVIVNGLASSQGVMLGQALGAGDIKRAKNVAQTGIFLMFYLLVIASFIIYIFRDPIVRFFIPTNPNVILGADTFLSIVLLGIPYFGIFRSISSTLNGSGHTVQGMVVGIVRLWGLRIPLVIYMAYFLGFGATGVWFGMAISNMISSGICGIFYFKGDWQHRIIKKFSMKIPNTKSLKI